eukprot:TRINITY_DN11331_c0_g1_i1.p1 TRINITY_DN11331_c0_g1~~TRINITY_DN11331_c0_g1_i1.p1  ORF type:complete len:217 (+),score=24.35 TRINITY_DN11331_c0_g1_i1:255-905(+)
MTPVYQVLENTMRRLHESQIAWRLEEATEVFYSLSKSMRSESFFGLCSIVEVLAENLFRADCAKLLVLNSEQQCGYSCDSATRKFLNFKLPSNLLKPISGRSRKSVFGKEWGSIKYITKSSAVATFALELCYKDEENKEDISEDYAYGMIRIIEDFEVKIDILVRTMNSIKRRASKRISRKALTVWKLYNKRISGHKLKEQKANLISEEVMLLPLV